jgi:hypothetical protein
MATLSIAIESFHHFNQSKEIVMKKCSCALILVIFLVGIANAQVTWTQVDSALTRFACAGSGVLGNYFYSFGTMSGPFAQAFNLTTEQWEASTTPPRGWNRYGSACTDNAIYLFGWCTTWPTLGDHVQKFTPSGSGPSGVWTDTLARYPVTVSGMAVAWDGGNFIYTAGGGDNTSLYGLAYKYDIANNEWTQLISMPVEMCWGGGAFINGKFYVVGGISTPQLLVEYDPVNETWTEKSAPPLPIYNGGGTTFSDSLIFCVGDGGISYPQSNAVQVYDPWNDAWTQETPLPLTLGCSSACFIPPDKVISAGGYMSGGYLSNTYLGTGFPTGGAAAVHPEASNPNPADFNLQQNYPNPFNPSTEISYNLPRAGNVSLRVYDLLGRRVAVLVDGFATAGNYRATFDGTHLSSGIYIAHLQAGNHSENCKMVLLK